jgi:hypothetical protein
MCDRPTTSAPIVLNNVLSEKFCFAKRIWRGPFFLLLFHIAFLFGCGDQRGLAWLRLLQLFEEYFVPVRNSASRSRMHGI